MMTLATLRSQLARVEAAIETGCDAYSDAFVIFRDRQEMEVGRGAIAQQIKAAMRDGANYARQRSGRPARHSIWGAR